MTRDHDSQRQKLYNAETFAFINVADRKQSEHWTHTKPGEADTVEQAQAYVNAALGHPAIRAAFGRSACKKVEVYFWGRGGSSDSHANRIRIGTECRSHYVILHELAHMIADRYFGRKNIAAHGSQFAGLYLYLVRVMMGDAAAGDLRTSFELYGVKFVKMWEPKAAA